MSQDKTLQTILVEIKSIKVEIKTVKAEIKTVKAEVGTIKKVMATRDDLKSFATKDDLKKTEVRLKKEIKDNRKEVVRTRDLLLESVYQRVDRLEDFKDKFRLIAAN